jgi:hypothetical protein
MNPVHIAGVGMTKFGKSPKSLIEIMCEATTVLRHLSN